MGVRARGRAAARRGAAATPQVTPRTRYEATGATALILWGMPVRSARRGVCSGTPLTLVLLREPQHVLHAQALQQRVPLRRVIAQPGPILLEEPRGVGDAEGTDEGVDAGRVDFGGRPVAARRGSSSAHRSRAAASSRGVTTRVALVFTSRAFRSRRSSVVQKKSAAATTAEARWSASNGLIPVP